MANYEMSKCAHCDEQVVGTLTPYVYPSAMPEKLVQGCEKETYIYRLHNELPPMPRVGNLNEIGDGCNRGIPGTCANGTTQGRGHSARYVHGDFVFYKCDSCEYVWKAGPRRDQQEPVELQAGPFTRAHIRNNGGLYIALHTYDDFKRECEGPNCMPGPLGSYCDSDCLHWVMTFGNYLNNGKCTPIELSPDALQQCDIGTKTWDLYYDPGCHPDYGDSQSGYLVIDPNSARDDNQGVVRIVRIWEGTKTDAWGRTPCIGTDLNVRVVVEFTDRNLFGRMR